MSKTILFLYLSLGSVTALADETPDVIQPAFDAVFASLSAIWPWLSPVAIALATILTVYEIIIGALGAYFASTPSTKDDERLKRFTEAKATKVVVYILGLFSHLKGKK